MDLTKLSFFELIDRSIRLRGHIEKCIRHSRLPTRRVTAETAASQDVKAAIDDVITKAIQVQLGGDNAELKQKKLSNLLTNLINVHRKLLQLVPRVPEPIELRSFLRQSIPWNSEEKVGKEPNNNDYFGKWERQILPLVFGSENLGDQSYFGRLVNSVSELNIEAIEMIDSADSNESVAAFAQKNLSQPPSPAATRHRSDAGYITIARIDVGSPIQWPALHHELGHKAQEADGIDTLWEKFNNFITKDDNSSIALTQLFSQIAPLFHPLSTEQEIRRPLLNWLLECWCDAFAVNTIGPAYLYSQLHSFIFSDPVYFSEQFKCGSSYPPAMVRIRLTTALLQARYELTDNKEKERVLSLFDADLKALTKLYGVQDDFGELDDAIVDIVNVFLPFLKSEFPPHTSDEQRPHISFNEIMKLEQCLGEGYPIPSLTNQDMCNRERATLPSEILIAGWHYRNLALRKRVDEVFVECFESNSVSEKNNSQKKSIDEFVLQLSTLLDRFDESMKRSLQVSEWFDVLHETVPAQESSDSMNKETLFKNLPQLSETLKPGLLSDKDLLVVLDANDVELDEKHILRIIPLIDRAIQIDGSVIDLRLGHNFEFFFSNVMTDVDPVRNMVDDGSSLLDSMEMEIDHGQGIRIAPGQFLLGHTLEYLKLPFDVAAQIEGRSSFARLGIQVHMTANLVEAGFAGCLTLEIANNGPATVKLYPGMRIAQLRFFRLSSEPNKKYTSERKYRGLLSHNKTKQFSDKEVRVFRSMQIG